MVHALTALADAPARDAIEHDLARDVEIDDEMERRSRDHTVELARLMQRAREAVEHEAVAERTARDHALFDHADDDLVGDEIARVHVALRLEPERGSLRGLRSEHVSGRDMNHAEVFRQTGRLSALPGTLSPEQHESGLLGSSCR